MRRKKIIFLVGPTATGKTEVSLHLAKLINAEIISSDSMQVYRGMDIGTQKPTAQQRKTITHHMIDIISPAQSFSAAEFRKRAGLCIEKILNKKKTPLFVGGTGLYMKALVDGLFEGPSADKKLREKLMKQEEEHGGGFLYRRLKDIDAAAASKIHPHDTRRIIRALEVYYKSKKPISELKKKTKGIADKYAVKIFGLSCDRERLYRKINRRVDAMFGHGFMKECRRLRAKKLSLTASQALGYKEGFDFLDSRISLKDAKELIKRNTRRFAKRQFSWFRNDKRVIWVETDKKTPRQIAEEIGLLCMK